MQLLIRCLAASYRRKLNILSTHKSMLSEGAAMPDESVDFCLQRRLLMKIICTKSEFAILIRNCQYEKCFEDCKNCWFLQICSEMKAMAETEIMISIEDICTIEDGD